ncbi:Flp pilus assembly protein TadB [Thalassovita gelatinovora]|uniref:Flp pilus assembly protein TadB n=1 Tax=Thalassovita gelatinovora TaxID=53501 RepID=A0A0P1F6W3_THAGE|nr:type II secretion system F family protein [Thalassovita gelatinovora]QIZ79195.1 type II secretion system F family protein [Thalassovita gelatinovora]CUH63680.1 Flp pilus assembly protein TadB [Thalassovita gelatinovora]SER01440.1 tight adherence protein C [Thalassovita gelatinovora]
MSLLQFISPVYLAIALTSVAGFALVLGMALPKLQKEHLQRRLAKVAIEHGGMRAMTQKKPRLSSLLAAQGNQPKLMQKLLPGFLADKSSGDAAQLSKRLKMAGIRSNSAVQTYVAIRVFGPVILGLLVLFYGTVVLGKELNFMNILFLGGGGGVVGFMLPPLVITNRIQKRQASIQAAWPDALDLMLICIESGYGIDAALMRLAEEIGMQSTELAEEISLTALELSYLQDRSQALDNLVDRTGLEQIRHVVGSLKQTEKYGTDLGRALRVHAKESRDLRLERAKQKAAALPPKLTVPMILFFLPILFVIIIAPAIIQIMYD